MATTGNPIGSVEFTKGSVTATSTDGITRILAVGDSVYQNEIIRTGDLSVVTITFNDSTQLDLGRSSEATLDTEVFNPAGQESPSEIAASIADIQAAIAAGQDPGELLAPTAAGPTAAGAPEADGGHSFVRVDLLGQRVTPESEFNTTGLEFNFDEPLPEDIPVIEEPLPSIAILDAQATEGDPLIEGDYGSEVMAFRAINSQGDPETYIEFTVVRSGNANIESRVEYSATPGSAIQPADYDGNIFGADPITGVVTFLPGETSKTILLDITDDFIPELTETFSVQLANPVNAVIIDEEGVGTIFDNDVPQVSLNPETEGSMVEEGEYLSFEVLLNHPGLQDAVVQLSASDGSAVSSDASATTYDDTDYDNAQFYVWSGTGYDALTGNQLTFLAGETSKTVYLQTFDNDPPFNEVMEDLQVSVDAISGATGSDSTMGYITDHDLHLPTLNISGGEYVKEGGWLAYKVYLDGESDQSVSADIAFGSGGSAQSDDYNNAIYSDMDEGGPTVTSLTFNPGETEAWVYVKTIDNDPPFGEDDETVQLELSDISNANAGATTALGTITDNPTISWGDVELGARLKEDAPEGINLKANVADSSDQLTTVTVSGFTEGWGIDTADIEANNPGVTATFTSGTLTLVFDEGIEAFDYDVLVSSPEDSDLDLSGLTLYVQSEDKADPSVTHETTVNDESITVDAVLDEALDVEQTDAPSEAESTSGDKSVGLDLNAFIENDMFAHSTSGSDFGGSDQDGSEQVTSITITISDGTLGLDGTEPSGTTLDYDSTDDEYTLSSSDPEAAIEALQVTVPQGWDGTINGSISITTSENPVSDGEFDNADNTEVNGTEFSVVITAGTTDPTVNSDSYVVSEESNPTDGGLENTNDLSITGVAPIDTTVCGLGAIEIDTTNEIGVTIGIGTSGEDTLTGTDYNDLLVGGEGSDILDGGDGADTFAYNELSKDGVTIIKISTSGEDTLTGTDYNGLLVGGEGSDILNGGDGADTFSYNELSEDGVTIIKIGTSGEDTLTGTDYNDLLVGGEGSDILNGGDGADTFVYNELSEDGVTIIKIGTSGEDTLTGTDYNGLLDGGEGSDILNGGDGADTFAYNELSEDGVTIIKIGTSGEDTLTGTDYNDLLVGGEGSDILNGGDGADPFAYNALSEGGVTIITYEVGADKLDLSQVFADADLNVDSLNVGNYVQVADSGGGKVVQARTDTSGVWSDVAVLSIISGWTDITIVVSDDNELDIPI